MSSLKKILMISLSLIIALVMLVSCDENKENDNTLKEDTSLQTGNETLIETQNESNSDTNTEANPNVPVEPSIVQIELKGNEFAVSKSGVVSASGNILSIVAPGTYEIKGTLDDAQIRVSVAKTEKVDIILCGVRISNKTSAPFYVESADKVTIELMDGTENVLIDCTNYVFPVGTDKPNACLYSSEDLTIKGKGSLDIKAYFNNGLGCKNDLKIKSGKISIQSPNNAIKGNQSVLIEDGKLEIKGADGIKSDSLVAGEGTIEIIGGEVNIRAGDDGLQATTSVTVKSPAKVTINAADKDVNCDGTTNIDVGTIIAK